MAAARLTSGAAELGMGGTALPRSLSEYQGLPMEAGQADSVPVRHARRTSGFVIYGIRDSAVHCVGNFAEDRVA